MRKLWRAMKKNVIIFLWQICHKLFMTDLSWENYDALMKKNVIIFLWQICHNYTRFAMHLQSVTNCDRSVTSPSMPVKRGPREAHSTVKGKFIQECSAHHSFSITAACHKQIWEWCVVVCACVCGDTYTRIAHANAFRMRQAESNQTHRGTWVVVGESVSACIGMSQHEAKTKTSRSRGDMPHAE